MPRRHIYIFKSCFADGVQLGRKRQTIRPLRKVMPEVDDIADLRAWTGRPYCSPQRRLREGTIRRIALVRIAPYSRTIHLTAGRHSILLGNIRAGLFAQADGFADLDAFFRFFAEQYGTEIFQGFVTYW